MRETIQNYFEKTKQYPDYYSNEDFSTICDDIKKKLMLVYFLLRGETKQICLYLKKNMDMHYLQKLMITLIYFGILVLEDIVIRKNLLYYFRFEKGRRFQR